MEPSQEASEIIDFGASRAKKPKNSESKRSQRNRGRGKPLQSKFDQELLLWKNQQKPIVFHLTFDLRGRETLTGKVLEVDQFFIKISEIPPTGKALWLGKGNLLAAGEF